MLLDNKPKAAKDGHDNLALKSFILPASQKTLLLRFLTFLIILVLAGPWHP